MSLLSALSVSASGLNAQRTRAELLVELCQVSHWGLDTATTRRYAGDAAALAGDLGRADLIAAAIGWQSHADATDGELAAIDTDRGRIAWEKPELGGLAIDSVKPVEGSLLMEATRQVMADSEFQRTLTTSGFEPVADSGPQRAQRLVSDELARWTPIIKATNFKLE